MNKKVIFLQLITFSLLFGLSEQNKTMTVYDAKNKYQKGRFISYQEYQLMKDRLQTKELKLQQDKAALINRLNEINAKKEHQETITKINIKPKKEKIVVKPQPKKINDTNESLMINNTPIIEAKAIIVSPAVINSNTKKVKQNTTPFQYGENKKSVKNKKQIDMSLAYNIDYQNVDAKLMIAQAIQTKDYSKLMAQNIIHALENTPKYFNAIDMQMVKEDFATGLNENKLKELQIAILSIY